VPEGATGIATPQSAQPAASKPRGERARVLLSKEWKPRPFPAPEAPMEPGAWLLIAERDLEEAWRRESSRSDASDGSVSGAIPRWLRPPKGNIPFRLRMAPRERPWLGSSSRTVGDLRGVVHLDGRKESESETEYPAMGIITLYQGLLRHFGPRDFSLLLVTRGAHFFSNPSPSLAGSALAGIVRMLGAEYGGLRARTVDLDERAWFGDAVDLVHRELGSADLIGEGLLSGRQTSRICHGGEAFRRG